MFHDKGKIRKDVFKFLAKQLPNFHNMKLKQHIVKKCTILLNFLLFYIDMIFS